MLTNTMLTNDERVVAQAIGQFYLQKNQGDYEKTRQEILELMITAFKVEPEKVTITTGRPGRLIGNRGRNIGALAQYLGRKIHIVENDLVDAFIPGPEPTDEELEEERMWKESFPDD